MNPTSFYSYEDYGEFEAENEYWESLMRHFADVASYDDWFHGEPNIERTKEVALYIE